MEPSKHYSFILLLFTLMYSTECNKIMKKKGLHRKNLITKIPNYTTFSKQPEARLAKHLFTDISG